MQRSLSLSIIDLSKVCGKLILLGKLILSCLIQVGVSITSITIFYQFIHKFYCVLCISILILLTVLRYQAACVHSCMAEFEIYGSNLGVTPASLLITRSSINEV